MSMQVGQTLSGLLNATFGNAVEIIVGIAALYQDEIRIVQTSVRPPSRTRAPLTLPDARFNPL